MSQIDPAARAAMLIPDSTRENYVTVIRRAAVARGISLDAARSQQLENWRRQHEAEPMGGWNVLADWLEKADLDAGLDIDPAEAAKVRALESAKRDPSNPQAAILDMSDKEVREEVEASRNQAAASSMSPVITDDGTEIPANQVDQVLAGDKPAVTPAKKPSSTNAK